MKKLLLSLIVLNLSSVKAGGYGDACNKSAGPYCIDPYVCSDGSCICPGSTYDINYNSIAVDTKYGVKGCKADAPRTTSGIHGDHCGLYQSCVNPFACTNSSFLDDGNCWCPGDSCWEQDSSSCVPCNVLGLGATNAEASKKKFLIPTPKTKSTVSATTTTTKPQTLTSKKK